MEAASLPPDNPLAGVIADLAREVGSLGSQVGNLANEVGGAKSQLETGAERMTAIEKTLKEVDQNQRAMDQRVNGRVGRIERTIKSLLARVNAVERDTMLNRVFVRIAHHRWVETGIATAIGIAVTYVLTK